MPRNPDARQRLCLMAGMPVGWLELCQGWPQESRILWLTACSVGMKNRRWKPPRSSRLSDWHVHYSARLSCWKDLHIVAATVYLFGPWRLCKPNSIDTWVEGTQGDRDSHGREWRENNSEDRRLRLRRLFPPSLMTLKLTQWSRNSESKAISHNVVRVKKERKKMTCGSFWSWFHTNAHSARLSARAKLPGIIIVCSAWD